MNRDRIELIARALENTAENVNGLKFGVDPNEVVSETVVEKNADYLRTLAEGIRLANSLGPVDGSFAVVLPNGYHKVVDLDPNLLSETNNSAPINKVSFTDYVRGKTRQWFPRR